MKRNYTKPSIANSEALKKARTDAKTEIKKAKSKFWEDFHIDDDINKINKIIKTIKSKETSQQISINGEPINDLRRISQIFLGELHKLNNEDGNKDNDKNNDKNWFPEIEEEKKTVLNKEIKLEEIKNILKNLNIKKACGKDEISNAMLKKGGKPMAKILTFMFNQFWITETYPKEWKNARLILVPKIMTKEIDISMLRQIALLSNIAKIFEKSILNKLKERNLDQTFISKRQTGFKMGKSTEWNLNILQTAFIMQEQTEDTYIQSS